MIASLLILAGTAVTGGFADLDAIDRQVAAFTGAIVGEAGGALTPVDRRLRLQSCRTGMALSWRTASQDSVLVQCGDAGGWRLFVPVRSSTAASAPAAVTRGDSVAIAVSGEGFTVSQPGEALESGPVGAWIKVRPTGAAGAGQGSRVETMRARVVRPGLVSLPLD